MTKLIEKHIPEHITKAKLMEMFKGSTKSAPAPTKVPTVKPGEKVKQPGKKNPFKIEPSQKPNPKARGPKWLSYNTFTSMGYTLK